MPGRSLIPALANISVRPVLTSGLSVPFSASPSACSALKSASTALMKSPLNMPSCLKARWTTPSALAAAWPRRTFFRHFTDKREVLFSGVEQLAEVWLDAVSVAPAGAEPLAIVAAGFGPLAGMFEDRLEFARRRARIIATNPELVERELIKLQGLAGELEHALVARGVGLNAAVLAAQAGVTVFHVAFTHWVEQDDPSAFRRLLDESLEELREVVAATPVRAAQRYRPPNRPPGRRPLDLTGRDHFRGAR